MKLAHSRIFILFISSRSVQQSLEQEAVNAAQQANSAAAIDSPAVQAPLSTRPKQAAPAAKKLTIKLKK